MGTARLKKAATKVPRPSSLHLRKLLNIHRNRNRIPSRIWPHDDPTPAAAINSAASSSVAGEEELTLNHPLIRAVDSCSPSQFDQVHCQLLVAGIFEHPLAFGRAVKNLCSSSAPRAAALFPLLRRRPDAFAANLILRSLPPSHALAFYRRSLIPPNRFTFPILAKILAKLRLPFDALALHARIHKSGFESDLFVRNSLVHLYSILGFLGPARMIFDATFNPDVVTWNSMIDGYSKNGMLGHARKLFDEMPHRDAFSYNTMISGHINAGEMHAAKELFSAMGHDGRDIVSWNSMIDGCAAKGDIAAAREMFDAMPDRNTVTWNSMLALYARTKDHRECLKLFDAMTVRPNEATFVSVLTSCASLGELERGKLVHSLIRDIDMTPDILLSTALLTMYAKCGELESAREVFDGMAERSVVTWNSMIVGYGLHGRGEEALELFLEMERVWGKKSVSCSCPNEATFVCVMSACAHAGMVFEGWWCFDRMVRVYGMEPRVEHFGCVVDFLGRAGLVEASEEMVARGRGGSAALWGALLSACERRSEWELGEAVGRKLIEAEPRDVGGYVMLSNIYAAEGRWDEVEKVREMMRENGLHKGAGVSSLGESVGRKSMVYSMLREMGGHLKLSSKGAF